MRSGGRWGKPLPLDILVVNLQDLIYSVPEYDLSMTYHPFTRDQVQTIRSVGECAFCGRRSKNGKGMIAHHKDPLGPATIENGRVVDKTCHDFISYLLRKVKNYPFGATKESFY